MSLFIGDIFIFNNIIINLLFATLIKKIVIYYIETKSHLLIKTYKFNYSFSRFGLISLDKKYII